jgi:hypothetical protein
MRDSSLDKKKGRDMPVPLHYSRGGRSVSFCGKIVLGLRTDFWLWSGAMALSAAAPAWAQYPGQVSKDSKTSPELRAVAVYEWTGDAGQPKSCRIVPVTVLDEGHLQDGGVYLARPQPMALAGEVEYQLENDGKTVGLFDIENAGQEQGSWVGYGKVKALPGPKAPPAAVKVDDYDADDDKPVLHRKKHADDAGVSGGGSGASGGSSGSGSPGSGSGTASNAPAPDSDRPVLHKAGDSGNGTPNSQSTDSQTPGTQTGGAAQADDSDRPKLKKNKKQPEMVGNVESLPDVSDPDRPRLKRGKSEGNGAPVLPSLMGLPQDMQQEVAVSDAKNRPDHPWSYTWANPGDEAKMKAALEDMAREALGLKPPLAPPAPKKTATTRHSLKPPPAPVLPPLVDEQFRVFELAYGSGATLVLTAHTDGPKEQMKFVTLVAQPDLYGDVLVLLKNVTDGAHLDENPRMRLVDAVDAMADNRGELLFELRGDTMRQFALYRVLRGRAEKLFVSGGGDFGTASD